jgi:hypothetical protein
MRPGGETDLAMQLWWRSVALQALRTYLAGPLAHGLVPDAGAQVCNALALMLVYQ